MKLPPKWHPKMNRNQLRRWNKKVADSIVKRKATSDSIERDLKSGQQ